MVLLKAIPTLFKKKTVDTETRLTLTESVWGSLIRSHYSASLLKWEQVEIWDETTTRLTEAERIKIRKIIKHFFEEKLKKKTLTL